MPPSQDILTQVLSLPNDFHKVGSFSKRTLQAIIRYCSELDIKASLETGCSKSTLLFSHFSPHHKVFALNMGESMSNVLSSPLLNNDTVEFIDGPSL